MVHHSLPPPHPYCPRQSDHSTGVYIFYEGRDVRELGSTGVYILLDLIRKGQSTICNELLFWSKTTPVNHFFYECILWYFAPITCWRTMKMLFTIYCNTGQQQILKVSANRPITLLIWVLFPERLDKFKWFEVFNGCIVDPWILLFRLQKKIENLLFAS